jgi:hypothetical protein
MSAIGFSRGKGFRMSAFAGYEHDHLVFQRQQSQALRALDWEKTPPLKSWVGLLSPWVGLAGLAALMAPFVFG